MNTSRNSSTWVGKGIHLAWAWMGMIILAALLAPYLANDRPIYIQQNGKHHFPIIEPTLKPGVNVGLSWYEGEYEAVVWPLVPFSANRLVYKRRKKPGTVSDLAGPYAFRHVLGTTTRGQDVLSGVIHGARTSLKIGLVGALLTGLIGILIGGLAGYWGNQRHRWTLGQGIVLLLGLPLAYFYGFEVRSLRLEAAIQAGTWPWFGECLLGLAIMLGILWLMSYVVKRIPWVKGPMVNLPLDQFVLKGIELVDALPTFLLIVIVGAMFPQKSIDLILILIALTGWTGIALLVRSQVLRERRISYVEAAYQLGLPSWRIVRHHILPNVISPILGLWALVVGRIIIIEATLSFLVLIQEEKSWGSLLQGARDNPDVWWQFVFPGLVLLLTIFCIQLIAEHLRKRYDLDEYDGPRMRT